MAIEESAQTTGTVEKRVDPVTTELIRNGLVSAAGQMRQVLMRTAFSQLIYEVLDFACAMYDRNVRLLAQAPSMALFLGTMDACIRAAVGEIGGEDRLEPGDVLLYNVPYGTGSHPQDAALVVPTFAGGRLVGYAVCKAHWVDIGGKDVYSTDCTDIHQEGTFFPGVKLYRAGERNDDVWRIIMANSRAPELLAGDVTAQTGAVRIGATALAAIVDRHGWETFDAAAANMFESGEEAVRDKVRAIPDGRYVAECALDGNGLDDTTIAFQVAVEIADDRVILDLTDAPDQQRGPVNSPLPGTVSAARVALVGVVRATEAPDDGQFRPLELRTRPGSLFEPITPAPAFAFWHAQVQLIEGFLRALAPVVPDIPADSGGDILAVVWWGHRRAEFQTARRETSEPWIDGAPSPVGQGASARADGANALMHLSEACTRVSPIEVWEAKNPWLVERFELAPDSCGAGERQGGLGTVCELRCLEDAYLTPVLEATKRQPQGLCGGMPAQSNRAEIRHVDGSTTVLGMATALPIEEGALYAIHSGGGGGYGNPARRSRDAIARDLADGYITQKFADRWYQGSAQEVR